jgi:hypothetical protein
MENLNSGSGSEVVIVFYILTLTMLPGASLLLLIFGGVCSYKPYINVGKAGLLIWLVLIVIWVVTANIE